MNFLNYIFGISTAFAQVTDKSGDNTATQTGSELAKLVANFIAAIPLWIAAIVIAFASYLIAIAVRRSIELKLSKEGIEEEHREVQIIAGRAAFFGTLTLGITIALSIVGIDLKPIVAAGAFGLGFALQDIIMNLISGVMILASRHFTIGDVITVNGVTGKIVEIQTRATIIKGFDGTKVIVPNGDLFSSVVVSKTSNPFRKITFIMGVGYGSDLKKVMELTLAVVNSIPWVLKKPKAAVIFTAWGDSTIDFKINVWIDSKGGKFSKVMNRVIMDVTKAYDEAGIDVPYPIQTVQLDKGDQAEVNAAEVRKKILEVKTKYQNKGLSKEGKAHLVNALTPASEVQSGQSWLNQAFKQVSNLTHPGSIPATETAITTPAPDYPQAPFQQPTAQNSIPSAPTNSTAVTPVYPSSVNGEGQNWLNQALQSQIAQTQAPVQSPAPIQLEQPAPVAPAYSMTTQNNPVSMAMPAPMVVESTPVVYGPPAPPLL